MAKLKITAQAEPRLQCVIEEQEIRGITYTFPGGPVAGYEWRLRVSYPATASHPSRTDWLPWVFGSHESVRAMMAQWSGYLAENPPPDRPTQLQ